MEAVLLFSRTGQEEEYSSHLPQGDIAVSCSCIVICLTHPRTLPLMRKISKAKCCMLWSNCYSCAALCLSPPHMKFDINWFQLDFQMGLSFGEMGTVLVMDYEDQNVSVSLRRGVEQNHALFIIWNFFSATDIFLYSFKTSIPLLSGLLWQVLCTSSL